MYKRSQSHTHTVEPLNLRMVLALVSSLNSSCLGSLSQVVPQLLTTIIISGEIFVILAAFPDFILPVAI